VLETGVDPRAFPPLRFLRLVHSSTDADVYAVRPAPSDGRWPSPGQLPGFRCGRGP
jgi:hypothetical protein